MMELVTTHPLICWLLFLDLLAMLIGAGVLACASALVVWDWMCDR